MYKLFLTFRYLTRKKIVIFPVLVVWLCVMMLIIVSSIMGGFVARVREANHDLYGDIIISGQSFALGFPYYDEIRHGLEDKFPKIVATTPECEAYGLVYVPAAEDSRPTKLVGLNVAEQMKVTKFRESLFEQYNARLQAVEDLAKQLPADRDTLLAWALRNADGAELKRLHLSNQFADMQLAHSRNVATAHVNFAWLWELAGLLPMVVLLLAWWRWRRSGQALFFAVLLLALGSGVLVLGMFWPILFPNQFELLADKAHLADMDERQADRDVAFVKMLPPGEIKTREELSKLLVPPVPSFDVPQFLSKDPPEGAGLPPDGAIVGAQMGFFQRDTRGVFVRDVQPLWQKVIVSVAPASSRGRVGTDMEKAVSHAFTLIDDSRTGQFDVDQLSIYAPLEIVQQMAGLRPDPEVVKENPAADFRPRVQQVFVRAKEGLSNNELIALRADIATWIEQFEAAHPDMDHYHTFVQTWEEKQRHYLDAVQMEKVMIVFILGLMSLVVIVVIFLIFYQIVRDKTRDIGIIKAVGGSEEGITGIFLIYGLFVGLIGGGLGIISGVEFVTHTNQIHEWIFQMTGIVIWDRSVYIFDHIPDKVNPHEVVIYALVALIAGVIGAFIPAVLAGMKDPVQAVRYE